MLNKILNIDYLLKNNKRVYYFGLGFIQVVLNDKQRVHFYNTNLPSIIDEGIHNHRYNFKSTILKGRLIEEIYQIKYSENNEYMLYNESCSKEREITNNIEIEVDVKSLCVTNQTGTYYRFFNEFHRVEFEENTISLLERSVIITDYAQVIKHKSLDRICPFSKVIEEKQLWNFIDDTIKN